MIYYCTIDTEHTGKAIAVAEDFELLLVIELPSPPFSSTLEMRVCTWASVVQKNKG